VGAGGWIVGIGGVVFGVDVGVARDTAVRFHGVDDKRSTIEVIVIVSSAGEHGKCDGSEAEVPHHLDLPRAQRDSLAEKCTPRPWLPLTGSAI
jgi:hypothetical protein